MRNKKGGEMEEELRTCGNRRNESPEELVCAAAVRTNGLKPATINHYLHGVDHNSFFLTGSVKDNKWGINGLMQEFKSQEKREK